MRGRGCPKHEGFSHNTSDIVNLCAGSCSRAMGMEGDAGDYDPFQTWGAAVMENRAQGLLWVDCVSTLSCEEMQDGYCRGG